MDYFNFEINNKKYSFLNHFILNKQEKDIYFSITTHDNKIISLNAKNFKTNKFINDNSFNDSDLANDILNKFFNNEIAIDVFYSNLYNKQLFDIQTENTIETDKVNAFALYIDETLYVMTQTEYDENFVFMKKYNNNIEEVSNEDEFLHVLSYFFPIILYKKLNTIIFDGFDLKIITLEKDKFAVFNGNDNYYILEEKESLLENNKFVFRYVKDNVLSKKEKKEINKIIKKERI